jgi:hypothetical protein
MGLDGMGMMLKSMGINPEEIKASIESFKGLANEVAARQKNVEAILARIEAKLDEALSDGQNVLSKESMAEHFAEAGAPILLENEVKDGERSGSN